MNPPTRRASRLRVLTLTVLVPAAFLASKAVFAKFLFGALSIDVAVWFYAALYFAAVPIGIALLLRGEGGEARWLDLYPAALAYQVAAATALWPPAGVVAIGFAAFVPFALARTRAGVAFFATLAAAEAAVLFSGFSLRDVKLYLGLAALAAGSAAAFAAFRAIARQGWRSRPAAAAFAFLPWVTVPCWYFYMMGANAPWLTRVVLSRPGMELLLPPTDELCATRAVVPLDGAFLVYTNRDRLYLLENGRLARCEHDVVLGRVDLPTCDPDRPALCYFPMVDAGLASFDLRACRWTVHRFARAHYDLLNADAARRYFALVDDRGATVTVIERLGPDDFRAVRTIAVRDLPGGGLARTVDFHGDALYLLALRDDGRLALHEYDLRRDAFRVVLGTTEKAGWVLSWHGVTIPGERTVYTDLSGKVAIHDWAGRPVATLRLLPLLRQVVYDERRRLCYVVDDFGLVYVVDPFAGAVRKVVFCGFKTKNVLLRDGDLYTASSAGLFRVHLDALLGAGR